MTGQIATRGDSSTKLSASVLLTGYSASLWIDRLQELLLLLCYK